MEIYCRSDKDWSDGGSCVPITCPALGAVEHGTVSGGDGISNVDQTVSVTCQDG